MCVTTNTLLLSLYFSIAPCSYLPTSISLCLMLVNLWPKLAGLSCCSVQHDKVTMISRLPTNISKMHIRTSSSHPHSL